MSDIKINAAANKIIKDNWRILNLLFYGVESHFGSTTTGFWQLANATFGVYCPLIEQ
jgi:hypothetical protein